MAERASSAVPRATYRIQFTPEFGFARAREIVDYLDALGVSHIYASPIFQARPGSQHGYDVADPGRLNDQLGGEAEFLKLSAALRARGMSLLLDIVPNHMAAHPQNRYWWNVLKHGRHSTYAQWFDIDWERGHGRVVLPVLGTPLEEVIAKGELKIERGPDGPELRYYEQRFPLAEGIAGGELREVLSTQLYELAFWREGGRRINYRRFFDVTELVAVCPEREDEFEASHALIARLVREGHATGLRVDHIDGLADPRGYLRRLRNLSGGSYVLVEKILAPDEAIPHDWATAGTTGYDTMNVLTALWVDPAGFNTLRENARRRIGLPEAFEDEMYRGKRQVIEQLFPGDLDALSAKVSIATGLPPERLAPALAALTAALPVYRTYIGPGEISSADKRVLAHAVADASRREPALARDLAAIGELIESAPRRGAGADFVRRWQQFTGPVMAKGVEDTAMYRYIALTCLNEVGGHVDVAKDSVAHFHEFCRRIAATHPHRMNATSTHDTKRSEDVRARIAVLAELAGEWHAVLHRWIELNQQHRKLHKSGSAPTARDEVLLYQTLIGVWPLQERAGEEFTKRIQAYMLKAVKEAKLQTSWIDPDEAYETAVRNYVGAVLDPSRGAFLEEIRSLAERTSFYGCLNGLSQTLLKLAMPGIPDLYQGCEMWDLSLVDPDNRRPVDYNQRREALAQVARHDTRPLDTFEDALRSWPDGRIKLLLTRILLRLRRDHAPLFEDGRYLPLPISGDRARNAIAFARIHDGKTFIAVAGRLLASIIPQGELPASSAPWRGTFLGIPEEFAGTYRETLTGRVLDLDPRVSLSQVFNRAPIAALISV